MSGRRLAPGKAATVARLLAEGLSLREVAERSGVHRKTVGGIKARLDAGEAVVVQAARRGPRIHTSAGRVVTQGEIMDALLRRTATEAAARVPSGYTLRDGRLACHACGAEISNVRGGLRGHERSARHRRAIGEE